jgi:1,4-dihydroxy-2-naphthoyl-CoA hydrolase
MENYMAEDFAAMVNAMPNGWVQAMGIVITRATTDEVACEWTVEEKHHQAYGIVHGGVHAGVIETLASVGAALVSLPRRQRVVGLENNTSFIRAVRAGKLTAVARPVTRGRSSQVWEAWIRDADERLVAQGRVRLLCIAEDAKLGET